MPKSKPRPPVTDADLGILLANSIPAAREIVTALRDLIRDTIPEAIEYYVKGWGAIGYRTERAGYFAGIFPRKDDVILLFEHGVDLPDPDGVLTGSGTQTRVISLTSVDAIPENAIIALLHAAVG